LSGPAAAAPSAGGWVAQASEDLKHAGELGDHKALEKALREGADPDVKDDKTFAALHWASKCGRVDDIKSLLAAGANVNAVNKAGVTPLIFAASLGRDDCVPLLLKAGADPSLQTARGKTALQAAQEGAAKAEAEDKPRYDGVLAQLSMGGDGTHTAAPA